MENLWAILARGYPIYIRTVALAFALAYTNAMDGNPTAETLEGRRDAGDHNQLVHASRI